MSGSDHCGRFLLLTAFLALLSACAAPAKSRGDRLQRSWPEPPDPPRILLVENITAADLKGGAMGFWARLGQLLIGKEPIVIRRPYGVWADQEKLLIADTGGGAVHLIDRKTRRRQLLLTPGGERFASPVGIAGDGRETVFISDSATAKIWRYDLGSRRSTEFTSVPLARPTGLAYHPGNDLLYAADTTAHQVIAFDRDGRERLRFGSRGRGEGQFNFPTDLAIDGQGRVHVSDSMNFRIQTFSADGEFVSRFGEAGDTTGRFAKPKGVAVDSEGHIYVADALFDTVQIFDDQGRLLLWFGEKGSGAGQFWMPAGMYIDADDFIYVVDSYNRRVQVFKYVKLQSAN